MCPRHMCHHMCHCEGVAYVPTMCAPLCWWPIRIKVLQTCKKWKCAFRFVRHVIARERVTGWLLRHRQWLGVFHHRSVPDVVMIVAPMGCPWASAFCVVVVRFRIFSAPRHQFLKQGSSVSGPVLCPFCSGALSVLLGAPTVLDVNTDGTSLEHRMYHA